MLIEILIAWFSFCVLSTASKSEFTAGKDDFPLDGLPTGLETG